MVRISKAVDLKISKTYLRNRSEAYARKGYQKTKWIIFCEEMLEAGFSCSLYEAKQTNSKYITVKKGRLTLKVRFSDHRPIYQRELAGDCDFFVGITHTGVRTTKDAIDYVMAQSVLKNNYILRKKDSNAKSERADS